MSGASCGAKVARWTGNPNVAGSVPTSVTCITVFIHLSYCQCHVYMCLVVQNTNKNLPSYMNTKQNV